MPAFIAGEPSTTSSTVDVILLRLGIITGRFTLRNTTKII
jgi:hypothetical protein